MLYVGFGLIFILPYFSCLIFCIRIIIKSYEKCRSKTLLLSYTITKKITYTQFTLSNVLKIKIFHSQKNIKKMLPTVQKINPSLQLQTYFPPIKPSKHQRVLQLLSVYKSLEQRVNKKSKHKFSTPKSNHRPKEEVMRYKNKAHMRSKNRRRSQNRSIRKILKQC